MQAQNPETWLLDLTGRIERIDDVTVVFCNELPLTGIGGTPDAAMKSFTSCLSSYFDAAEKDGNLEDLLSEHSVTPVQKEPKPSVTHGSFHMKLPFRHDFGAVALT